MKCPHCGEGFFPLWNGKDIVTDDERGVWGARATKCPSCQQVIIKMIRRVGQDLEVERELAVYPKVIARPVPPEVPVQYAEDFIEANLVLRDSPKASAALSRRCLQNLLRDVAGVKPGDLYTEIGEVLPKLPSDLAEAVDAVRAIGNFAAHPMKSKST